MVLPSYLDVCPATGEDWTIEDNGRRFTINSQGIRFEDSNGKRCLKISKDNMAFKDNDKTIVKTQKWIHEKSIDDLYELVRKTGNLNAHKIFSAERNGNTIFKDTQRGNSVFGKTNMDMGAPVIRKIDNRIAWSSNLDKYHWIGDLLWSVLSGEPSTKTHLVLHVQHR